MEKIKKEMAPSAIATILGDRLRQARLNANVSQSELAIKSGLSRNAVISAESGKALLETFVALLQALDVIDHLDMFMPPAPASPIQLLKMQGRKRIRASAKEPTKDLKETW